MVEERKVEQERARGVRRRKQINKFVLDNITFATDYTETFCLTKSKYIFSNGLCLTHMYTQTGFTLPVYFLTWHWPSAVHYQNPLVTKIYPSRDQN